VFTKLYTCITMKQVYNFFKGVPETVYTFGGRRNLRLMLWAGDYIRDEITDVERLSNFDIYICNGLCGALDANANYLKRRVHPGIICVLDILSQAHFDQFATLFGGRFSIIDSDYNGNTPKLDIAQYKRLLAPGGKAYNIQGINSLRMPLEDFQNTLELFAPVLSADLNARRTYTAELIQIAKYNDLPASMAWTSPDIKHPDYEGVRNRQLQLMMVNEGRNPVSPYSQICDSIEEYWEKLSDRLILAGFTGGYCDDQDLNTIIQTYSPRFKKFLQTKLQPFVTDDMENLSIKQLQGIYSLHKECGERVQFGYYTDTRHPILNQVFGHWLSFPD